MITSFRGEYFFLSNFYESPITYKGLTFRCVESAFQAQKTLDEEEKKKFTELSGSEAKRLGRRVKLREDWEKVKYSIMDYLVKTKFYPDHIGSQFVYTELSKKLLDTSPQQLVEVNTWGDTYWGVCSIETCKKLGKPYYQSPCFSSELGFGANMLGMILENIRTELKVMGINKLFIDMRGEEI